jgi:hypothetical protein
MGRPVRLYPSYGSVLWTRIPRHNPLTWRVPPEGSFRVRLNGETTILLALQDGHPDARKARVGTSRAISNGSIESIKAYRKQHNASLHEAKNVGWGQGALDLYYRITGFRETNVNAIWHHRLSQFGPPCAACGKPLRTPRAKFCAACGAPRERWPDSA